MKSSTPCIPPQFVVSSSWLKIGDRSVVVSGVFVVVKVVVVNSVVEVVVVGFEVDFVVDSVVGLTVGSSTSSVIT